MTSKHFIVPFKIGIKGSIRNFQELLDYYHDLKQLRQQQSQAKFSFPFGKPLAILDEKNSDSGTAKGHYFHQDLLVARRIFKNKPARHVDIGSRIDGFVAHVASYREIEVVDIRNLPNYIPNVTFRQADVMSNLDPSFHQYCDSLSSLHALEHFGLGRYGDPINFSGHLIGLKNMHKMLADDGTLYLSVPIGPQRINFNAHRVFAIKTLLEMFDGLFQVLAMSYVDDNGDLFENVTLSENDIKNNLNCNYGCGIFELKKLSVAS